MLINDLFCYGLFLITVTATCAKADEPKEELVDQDNGKHITKRDATMLIDNFPMDAVYHRPKVIYRRISRVTRPRYGPPKPKYGPPRPKYGPPKTGRKPGKKYHTKHVKSKYGPPGHKKRRTTKPKPRYGPPKRPSKPVYGPPQKMPPQPKYQPPAATSFAEPPTEYGVPENRHKEPPVDSYGAPIKSTTLRDLFPTPQGYRDTNDNFEADFESFGQEYKSWKSFQQDQKLDNSYAYSKKHPTVVKPESPVFVTPVTPSDNEDNLVSYSDIYTYKEKEKKTKPQLHESKFVNRPWKMQKKPEKKDEEIIVGGQYAEPPARYVHRFQPSAAMLINDDDDFIPARRYVDPDVAESATTSPYVNYKNSNMAFSPQNLNDAFSIVDN